MTIILSYILKILFAYLLADFIVGIYHWIKDSYFTPFTPIIGKTFIWYSRLHHIRPKYVTEFTDWQLFSSSAIWTFLWMGPLFLLIGPTLFLTILFLMISLNDVIHKYAHLHDHERPALITWMQQIYLIQSQDEHHLHHISPHDVNYCPITPYVNVVLERLDFWRKIENLVEKFTGVKPRSRVNEFIEDSSYPGGIRFLP